MSVVWSLKAGAVEQSLAAWGIERPHLRRVSQAASEFTFEILMDFDADSPFDFEQTLTLYRTDGGSKVKWFAGPCLEPERSAAAGNKELLKFRVLCPWYWLDNKVMMQTWKSWDNATSQLVDLKKSRLFLGLNAAGQTLNQAQALTECLAWAVAGGAPLQYDTAGFPDANFPVVPANQVSIAAAIKLLLAITPDAVTWWDFSTEPTPTLRIKRRADLATVSRSLAPGEMDGLQITARRDLVRPAVVINYEITSTVNGQARVETVVDKWPEAATGEEHKAAVFTVNLQGPQTAFQFADVAVAAINADHADKATRCAWWSAKVPWLSSAGLGDHAITDFDVVNVTRETSRPNEPTTSNLGPWMVDDDGDALQTGTEQITGLVKFTRADGTKGEKVVPVRVTSTNATTRFYSTLQTIVSGEPVPAGLAHKYFDAVNAIQYQGRHVVLAAECAGEVGIGNKLNLTGGREAWATMAAVLWEVVENIDTGETAVSFGPPENLAPPDLVANLELWRSRVVWMAPATMSTATAGALGSLDSTDAATKENTVPGVDRLERMVMEDATRPYSTGGPRLDLNVADITANREIKLREVEECREVSPGVFESWRRLVLASDVYAP